MTAVGRTVTRGRDVLVRHRVSPHKGVWLYIGLLVALAAVLYVGVVRELPGPRGPLVVPWWVVALSFYVVEIKVVHLQFRRGAHSFSLSEVPLVMGLFFASPSDVVLAHALAGGLALYVHRRQPAMKLAFNIANFALCTGTAVVVFNAFAAGSGIGPIQWAAAIAAVAISNSVGLACVTAVITLSEGRPRYPKMLQVAAISTIVALTNASLALLAVTLIVVDVRAVWLLAIPIATLFFGYRSYLAERQQHETMELLYESSRVIQRSPELDSALVALLEHTRAMFRAERAEIRLYSGAKEDEILLTAVGPAGEAEVMVPRDGRQTEPLRARLAAEGKGFVVAVPTDAGGLVVRNAMVAPLRNDAGPIGIMLVANRLGDVNAFTDNDCRLFETVANHAATALENGQLERSLAQLSSLKEELRHRVYHDALTGLANRAAFVERVEREMAGVRTGLPVVLFVDVDDFKIVNDTAGHATGDALLAMLGERLRGCLRADDLAARLGGDEFGVLLVDDEQLTRALRVADRIITTVHEPFVVGGREVRVGASIGIAAANGSLTDPNELLRNADMAMYTAKSRGKAQFAVFEPGMHERLIERLDLSADLERAVGQNELLLKFQPVVSLADGRIVGAEALIRWRHPLRGLVSPADFIGVAEESDAILPIGRWVLFEACREAKRWEESGVTPWISVNLSARQVQQASFLDEVAAALEATGLAPDRLVLEVTETLMMQDVDGMAQKLAALKKIGVRTAVDDFGTGYSSLSYLRRFPVDLIKIAREFVEVAADDEWVFAHAIIGLGHTMGIEIVAEGVERVGQADRLRSMGCDSAQGYFFSRPLPPSAILRRLGAEPAGAGYHPALSLDAPPIADGLGA